MLDGRCHADVGADSYHEEILDAAAAQEGLEIGAEEGVVASLVEDSIVCGIDVELIRQLHARRALETVRWLELELDSEVGPVSAMHLLREDHWQTKLAGSACEAVDARDQIHTPGGGNRGARIEEVSLHIDDENRSATGVNAWW
jgi:hypothetical protein